MSKPDKKDIESAYQRIKTYIHRTPVFTSENIDTLTQATLFFKAENLQKVGAFKARGAINAVLSLKQDELANGVATHSSGNHGQALAWAAKNKNTNAYIVVPSSAPKVKKAAMKSYGAHIIECAPNQKAREKTLEKVVEETGACFIHPYNDYRIIEGQATAAYEVFQDLNNLDYLLTPVGGGGLLSGSCLTAAYFSPNTKVIGCEPEGADDAYRSLQAGEILPSTNPDTIADGLLTSLGDKTFPIIREHVSEVITVNDDLIIKALELVWQRLKLVIEPSAAVPLACVLKEEKKFRGKKVAIIFSGGNIELPV